MRKSKLLLQGLLVGLLSILFLVVWGPTAQGAEKKIVVGYSAIEGGVAPLWTGHAVGIFPKYGLETELVYIGSGTQATQVLLSGSIPLMSMGGALINANLAGADTVTIAGSTNVLVFELMTQPGIQNAQQLKGGTIAISRFGSVSDTAARLAVRQLGLDPNKDVTILQVGGTTGRIAALKAGKVQGAMVVPPLTYEGQKQGFKTLVDLAAQGIDFPMMGIGTTRSYIAKEPNTVRAFMKGYVEGIAYFKGHRDQGIQIIAKNFKLDDLDLVAKMYDLFADRIIPRKPYASIKGFETFIGFLAEKDPRAKNLKAAEVVDNRFVEELDKSGFIDQLYKK